MYVVLFFSTYSMLNALLERRDERKKQVKKDDVLQQQAEIYEVKVWKKFWDEESPGLLLYACLHGTVEIVDYFVTKHVSPTTKYAYHVYVMFLNRLCHRLT